MRVLLAIAVSFIARLKMGRAFVNVVDVALDNSYPTGGEALSARELGMQTVLTALPELAAGYVARYNQSTGKLMVYYGDNNNASDGPLIEVPNATDLSAVTVRMTVIGR